MTTAVDTGGMVGPRKRWMTTGEVALALEVSEDTVRRWCESGKAPATRLGPGHHWRVSAEWLRGLTDRVRPFRRRKT